MTGAISTEKIMRFGIDRRAQYTPINRTKIVKIHFLIISLHSFFPRQGWRGNGEPEAAKKNHAHNKELSGSTMRP